MYKNLESEQISTEDEGDDKERRTEDEEIDRWEESETDSDEEADSDSEDSDYDDGLDKRKDPRLLKGYIFGIEELFLLEEKLGSWGGFLLKFDLLNGEVLVRTVPGLLHETTAQYFTFELIHWSNIPGRKDLAKYALTGVGAARMLFFLLL